jgi:hypothetical protein
MYPLPTQRFGVALVLTKPWSVVQVDLPRHKTCLLLLVRIASTTQIFEEANRTW